MQSASDMESLQETVAHQKYEIVRLLNTVKTLSSENTKLLKVRAALNIMTVRACNTLVLTRSLL